MAEVVVEKREHSDEPLGRGVQEEQGVVSLRVEAADGAIGLANTQIGVRPAAFGVIVIAEDQEIGPRFIAKIDPILG